jgi:hypothetical protein
MFWDRDGDRQIYPWDTYVGFRDLGFSVLFSLLAMVIINVNFSYPTRLAVSWWPDVWFRVYVGGIHKAKVSNYVPYPAFLVGCWLADAGAAWLGLGHIRQGGQVCAADV